MPPTASELKLMANLRTFFCIPSFIGSSFIVAHVLRNKTRRKQLVKSRVLLGMSIMDLLFTTATFCNIFLPLPLPPKKGGGGGGGPPSDGSSRVLVEWLASRVLQPPEDGMVGPPPDGMEKVCRPATFPYDTGSANQMACSAIGFFTQGGRFASVLYNCTLTTYYLLLIRYGWKEHRLKKLGEPFFHTIPLILGWTTAIIGAATQSFNTTPTGCDLASYPPGCFGGECCTRGKNGEKYLLWMFLYPLWGVWIFLIVAMILIYMKVRTVENKTNRHSTVLAIHNSHRKRTSILNSLNNRSLSKSSDHDDDKNTPPPVVTAASLTASALAQKRQKSRDFAKQALFYCLAFALAWICFSVLVSGRFVFDWRLSNSTLLILSNILAPMQGLFNAIVYIWPFYTSQRRKQKRKEKEEEARQKAFARWNHNNNEDHSNNEASSSVKEEAWTGPETNSSSIDRRGSSSQQQSRFFALTHAIFGESEDSEDFSTNDMDDEAEGDDKENNSEFPNDLELAEKDGHQEVVPPNGDSDLTPNVASMAAPLQQQHNPSSSKQAGAQ